MRLWTNVPCGDQCVYKSLTKTSRMQVTEACAEHTSVNRATEVFLCTMGHFLLDKSPFALFACVTGPLRITVSSQYGQKDSLFLVFFFCPVNLTFLTVLFCLWCLSKINCKGKGNGVVLNIERNLIWVKSNLSGMFIFLFLLNEESKDSLVSEENWIKLCWFVRQGQSLLCAWN